MYSFKLRTMKETEVRFLSKPKLRSPIVILGLPGIGLVGKIAVDHLVAKTKAKKFCELYSPSFPPQVITDEEGIVRMVRNEFYHFASGKKDIIIIAGDFQGMSPESQYEITGKLLDVVQGFKPKMLYTLGGLATGRVQKEPQVYGAATDKKVILQLKDKGIKFSGREGGGIFGASGLLLGMGKLRGIDGLCIMGETVGQVVDAKAAKVVLQKLAKLLSIEVDMKDLDKQAEQTEKELEKLAKMQEEQAQALQMALTSKASSDEDVMRYIR